MQRRVYLQAGFAYVPGCDLVSILVGLFKSRLLIALQVRTSVNAQKDHT